MRLAENEVQVWAQWLNVSVEQLANFSATLSSSEKERAAKFKFGVHRDRYIAGRGFLRQTLSRYLQIPPCELDFNYSANGKPTLISDAKSAPLHFNLAHSGDLALLAVTRMGAVGVDVESIRPVKDADYLVERFFSERENLLFQKLAPEEKPGAFFNLWTRKEALLKATGEGISGGLNRVEVSFLANEPACLLAINGSEEQAREWTLHAMQLAQNFVGAVAIQVRPVQFAMWTAS